LIRFRPVSSAFRERSKRRRKFAQKVRIFGREERSLRSTAVAVQSLRFQEFPKSPSSPEGSAAVVRVSPTANAEVVGPYPPFIIWLGTRPFGRFDSGSSRTPVFVSVENTKQAELIRSV